MEGCCALFCRVDYVGWVVECVGAFAEEFVVEVWDGFSMPAEVEDCLLNFFS